VLHNCYTLLVAILFGVYLSEFQLTTSISKQQYDELVQQKTQLKGDNQWLKSTNKQLTVDNEQLKSTNKQFGEENKQLKTTNKLLSDENKQLQTITVDNENKQLKTPKKQLDDEPKRTNKQLNNDVEHLTSMYASISHEHVTPVIFKMNNFTERMKNKQEWYSDPFFSFWRGYKMCLEVYAGKVGKVEEIHVYLYLMKGPYDDELEQSGHWPLRGMFKVELLEQFYDGEYTVFLLYDSNVPTDYTNRVIEGNIASKGWGTHMLNMSNDNIRTS